MRYTSHIIYVCKSIRACSSDMDDWGACICSQFRSVVFITFASHVKDLGFEALTFPPELVLLWDGDKVECSVSWLLIMLFYFLEFSKTEYNKTP